MNRWNSHATERISLITNRGTNTQTLPFFSSSDHSSASHMHLATSSFPFSSEYFFSHNFFFCCRKHIRTHYSLIDFLVIGKYKIANFYPLAIPLKNEKKRINEFPHNFSINYFYEFTHMPKTLSFPLHLKKKLSLSTYENRIHYRFSNETDL